jgi:hypothetical protein
LTVTNYLFTPLGSFTLVQVTSDLVSPTFFWYLDGVFYERTAAPEISVFLEEGDQAEIVAVDTIDPENFDVIANAPVSQPARRTLWWVRSVDLDASRYVIRQQREAEGYIDVGTEPATDAWSYRYITPRLDDLTQYDWRIVPFDLAGNEGAPFAIGPEQIVRKPDAPDFVIAFDGGTTRVEFDLAP